MLFSQIPGLEALKAHLAAAVQRSHVSHALLFHGAEGGAQLAMALAFATYINCENKTDADACGSCANCSKIDRLAHPDFHFVFPTVKTKKIKTDDASDNGPSNIDGYMPFWREFVAKHRFGNLAIWHEIIGAEKNQQAIIPAEEARKIIQKISLKAYEGAYKIMLVWLPEMMNATAANAILKILEEPPAKTIFLLVCNDPNKLLTTIRSRTLAIHVPTIAHEAMIPYLQESLAQPAQRATQIAQLADGNLLAAQQIAKSVGNDLFQYFKEWMRQCYKNDLIGLVQRADQFDTMDKTSQKQLIEYALGLFRSIFLGINNTSGLIKLEAEQLDFVSKFANTIQADKMDNILTQLSETHYYLERNAKAKILFMDLSLHLIRYFKR
jgi:DNA polymerase III subunit delta'